MLLSLGALILDISWIEMVIVSLTAIVGTKIILRPRVGR